MSLSEEQKILLSQLVDGELPPDEANAVLTDVFDDLADVLGTSASAMELSEMLRLRRSLAPWRHQEPDRAIAVAVGVDRRGEAAHGLSQPRRESSPYYRLVSMAAAAMLGGVLVAGGVFVGGRSGPDQPLEMSMVGPPMKKPARPLAIVTAEQRREIARAFALHESVAGPLSWYAADDASIQVAPAQKGEASRQPIAVVLRLSLASNGAAKESMPPKTYVIVCRNDDTAAMELPPSVIAKNLRLRLLSTASGGEVKLQYMLVADDPQRGRQEAALAGQRQVGLGSTSLGQLALDNCLVNVDASAWAIRNNTP